MRVDEPMRNARYAGRFWPIPLILAAMIVPSSPRAQQLPAEMPAPTVLKVKKDETKRIRRGKSVETPDAPPIPEARPQAGQGPQETRKPAPSPAINELSTEGTGTKTPSPQGPIPDTRPAEPSPPPETPVAAPVLPPKPALPSREELACRTRLTQLGAVFKEATPVINEQGCNMPHPIEMSRLTEKIDIAPGVVLNCATAETAARFIRDVASPAAKGKFGAEIKSIAQASGFVCRPRNGTTKLSEHAFGNALDIASFTLTNGTIIAVEPAPPPKNEKFLRVVRNAACGPFKTVLGPGSNADHALHFHFDLAPQRNGGTYCK